MAPGCRLYVGFIPIEVKPSDLTQFFHGYGEIKTLILKRGFAFVEMSDPRDAEDAIRDLNGRQLFGRAISVDYAKSRSNAFMEGYASEWHLRKREHSRSRSPHRDESSLRRRRSLTPQAAAWYGKAGRSREVEKVMRRRRSRSRSREHSSRQSHSYHRNTGISPKRSPLHSAKHSPSPGSVIVKQEHPVLDEYEEFEEEDEAADASSGVSTLQSLNKLHDDAGKYFRLLDYEQELDAIANEFGLDINIRALDSSVAFGGVVAPSASAEKWLVFADKGTSVRLSGYEASTLVKEHDIPKFEWELFSATVRGMCEKFLLNK